MSDKEKLLNSIKDGTVTKLADFTSLTNNENLLKEIYLEDNDILNKILYLVSQDESIDKQVYESLLIKFNTIDNKILINYIEKDKKITADNIEEIDQTVFEQWCNNFSQKIGLLRKTNFKTIADNYTNYLNSLKQLRQSMTSQTIVQDKKELAIQALEYGTFEKINDLNNIMGDKKLIAEIYKQKPEIINYFNKNMELFNDDNFMINLIRINYVPFKKNAIMIINLLKNPLLNDDEIQIYTENAKKTIELMNKSGKTLISDELKNELNYILKRRTLTGDIEKKAKELEKHLDELKKHSYEEGKDLSEYIESEFEWFKNQSNMEFFTDYNEKKYKKIKANTPRKTLYGMKNEHELNSITSTIEKLNQAELTMEDRRRYAKEIQNRILGKSNEVEEPDIDIPKPVLNKTKEIQPANNSASSKKEKKSLHEQIEYFQKELAKIEKQIDDLSMQLTGQKEATAPQDYLQEELQKSIKQKNTITDYYDDYVVGASEEFDKKIDEINLQIKDYITKIMDKKDSKRPKYILLGKIDTLNDQKKDLIDEFSIVKPLLIPAFTRHNKRTVDEINDIENQLAGKSRKEKSVSEQIENRPEATVPQDYLLEKYEELKEHQKHLQSKLDEFQKATEKDSETEVVELTGQEINTLNLSDAIGNKTK